MNYEPNLFYHIYNQGNNKEKIFSSNEDYNYFLFLVRKYIFPHCEIISYCLMPNHFHFIIYTDDRSLEVKQQGNIFLSPVSNGFRLLLSKYAQWYNNINDRSGALFKPRTKSKALINNPTEILENLYQLEYLITCFEYVHNNPVKAGLVKNTYEWDWSSARSYFNGTLNSLCNKEIASKFLADI